MHSREHIKPADPFIGYAFYVSDLDGTLLNGLGVVSSRTKAAIEGIRSSGARFTIATARSAVDAVAFARELGLTDPIICQNGAIVYSPLLGRVISEVLLSQATVADIVRDLRLNFPGASMAIDYPMHRVADPSWPGPFGRSPAQLTLWPLAADEIPRRRAATIMLRDAWSDGTLLEKYYDVTVTTSLPGLLEVSKRGAEKGRALARVCKLLGIGDTSVVSFGDMPNDLSMLRRSGLSVAMANAHHLVKQAADVVAPANVDDGVAVVLESLLRDLDSATTDTLWR